MKILIAEDDVVSRRLLRGHLEKWGHDVTEAKDGSEAWDIFVRANATSSDASTSRSGTYPIVVVDWMMPLMDGLELIQRIRAKQLPHYTYILMLTAKNQKHDVVTGMDAGADDYLTKPFDKEELRARLQAGQRILDLQAALTRSEKSASVGRLATGVAAEISTPIAEVLQALTELRSDSNALIDALSPQEAAVAHHEPDAPPAPARPEVDVPALRSTLGPRFVAAEQKLNRVRDVVRNLRDFSRLDELPTRSLAMGPLLADTLAMMRQELASREIAATFTPPGESFPQVTGNAGKLKRAFYNLLSVLAESSNREQTLALSLAKEGSSILVTMTSGAPGLPATSLKNLFEPFTRLGDPAECPRSTLQSGLGLPIAFSIIREHGGALDALTHSDGRTVFQVRLPAI